jgi:hypothetical protein
MKRLVWRGAFLLLVASCATSSVPLELRPGLTPFAAASELQRLGSSVETIEAHVRIESEEHRFPRVRANASADREGNFRIDLLTPLGTIVGSLFVRESEVLFVNYSRSAYWRGSPAELTPAAPSLAPIVRLRGELARLLFALPPAGETVACAAAADGQACFQHGELQYVIEGNGVRSAALGSGEATITFDPPSFPPRHARLSTRDGAVTVDYLDVSSRRGAVKPPDLRGMQQTSEVPGVE